MAIDWPGDGGARPTGWGDGTPQGQPRDGSVAAPRSPGPEEVYTPPPPPGQAPSASSGEVPSRPRNNHFPFAVWIVVTAVVAGGAGAGIALLASGPSGPTAKPVALPTAAKGNSSLPTTSGMDVQAIAQRVDQATVDITAVGPEQGQDEGTGIVLTPSGLVLTNNHVIESSTEVNAQVNGAGPTYSATVIGADPSADVALLQLHGATLWKTASLGDSSKVAIGDPVVAIGNALDLPGPETVTSGIISGVDRSVTIADPIEGTDESLTGLLQTSAALSSGNSGGPLVDAQGLVIAMDTAAASTGSGVQTASDVGFAIPINAAMAIARQIEAGKASATIHIGTPAATGLALTSVPCAEGLDGCLPLGFGAFDQAPFGGLGMYQSPVSSGAVVAGMTPGCPAVNAGLQVGDVITGFNGQPVSAPDQVDTTIAKLKAGDDVTVGWVSQNGSHHTARFQLIQGENV